MVAENEVRVTDILNWSLWVYSVSIFELVFDTDCLFNLNCIADQLLTNVGRIALEQ